MKRRFLNIWILLITLLPPAAFAQQAEEEPGIKVIGGVTRQSIKLRWAPNNPTLWQFANKYGYTIERITLSENNQVLSDPPKVLLNSQPIKPAAQALWEPHMDNDDYVAVAAQAIYGEDFELVESQFEVMKVINKAKEMESRFSFALFSADQSIKAAELSGLYFEDIKVVAGQKYLYRVYANIPPELHKADTGFFFAGLSDYQPLPTIVDLSAEFKDHLALLRWNGMLFQHIYNSFWVERSDDGGKTFKRITEQPVVNTFSGDAPKTRFVFKTDSLPSNDVVYHYRVTGINAFGETGPPSDTVAGAGKPVFAYSAAILTHSINDDGTVTLQYSFPQQGDYLLRSFDLTRVDPKTKTTVVIQADIEKSTRTVSDQSPRSSNYYVIRAHDRYGRANNSFPYLVQLEDSIPPVRPAGMTGRIDTSGYVYLDWQPNREEDLLGYAIYRTNFNSEEFIQVKGPIRSDHSYIDTIRIDNLTEKIHYKVSAIDKRFNYSEFSETLTLQKPDIIPPVPPVFEAIHRDSLGIHIRWIASGSEDVEKHLLYRRAETDEDWTLISVFTAADTTRTYKDTDLEHRRQYAYTMLAVDDSGLESIPSEPIIMRWLSARPYPEVNNIFFTVDKSSKRITLTWNYDQQGVDRYFVYRSNNGEPLKLYKSVDASQRELIDSYRVSDASVEYRIAVGFVTGERTRMSQPVVVKM